MSAFLPDFAWLVWFEDHQNNNQNKANIETIIFVGFKFLETRWCYSRLESLENRAILGITKELLPFEKLQYNNQTSVLPIMI